MNEIEAIFTRKLKERRMSPQKAAAKAGVGTVTVYRFVRGEGNPSLSTLQAMLNAVGLRLEVVEVSLDSRETSKPAGGKGEELSPTFSLGGRSGRGFVNVRDTGKGR